MYKLSQRSEDRIKDIHPLLKVIIKKAIESPDCPEDFGIPQYGGLRTVEDQQALYAIGRTADMGRKPVTFTDGVIKKSNHQAKEDGYGHAFDVYIYCHKEKKASWNVERLEKLARHLIKVASLNGITLGWGGDWKKFKDYPHFEIAKFNIL